MWIALGLALPVAFYLVTAVLGERASRRTSPYLSSIAAGVCGTEQLKEALSVSLVEPTPKLGHGEISRRRFAEEQIIKALKEVDGGPETRNVCRRLEE
jgi:hypothetical protein